MNEYSFILQYRAILNDYAEKWEIQMSMIENKNLSKLIEHNSSIVLHYVKHGIDNTMNKFN